MSIYCKGCGFVMHMDTIHAEVDHCDQCESSKLAAEKQAFEDQQRAAWRERHPLPPMKTPREEGREAGARETWRAMCPGALCPRYDDCEETFETCKLREKGGEK